MSNQPWNDDDFDYPHLDPPELNDPERARQSQSKIVKGFERDSLEKQKRAFNRLPYSEQFNLGDNLPNDPEQADWDDIDA